MRKINKTSQSQSSDSLSVGTSKGDSSISKNAHKVASSNFQRIEEYLNDKYDIRYNCVSNEVQYKLREDVSYEVLNSASIYRELEHNGYRISIANLEALLRSDFVQTYNPLTDYFENLPEWTQAEPDWITLLANHVLAADQDRFNYHFKKAVVRTVACVIDSSYFNKHAFILIGRSQNTGKTTFIRFLCPDQLKDYFTENISTTDKDGLITISENFIISLDELSMLGRADINKLKSMFSMQNIKVRHPYGKKAETTPRYASFFGSTNEDDFLIDVTGSVRWLCFEILGINFNYSKPGQIDINRVWAQAYSLYKSREFVYHLTKNDLAENDKVNQKFRKNSAEFDYIIRFYEPGTAEDNDGFYTATDFLEELALKSSTIKFSVERIGKALVALQFEKKQKRMNNPYPEWGYFFKHRLDQNNPVEIPTTPATDNSNDLPF